MEGNGMDRKGMEGMEWNGRGTEIEVELNVFALNGRKRMEMERNRMV